MALYLKQFPDLKSIVEERYKYLDNDNISLLEKSQMLTIMSNGD